MIDIYNMSNDDTKTETKDVSIELTETKEDVEIEFTNMETGLTTPAYERLLEKWGPNEVPEKIVPCCIRFLNQFWGPMPIMIEVAAVLSMIVTVSVDITEWRDFVIIVVILFVNAVIGFNEEMKAYKSKLKVIDDENA